MRWARLERYLFDHDKAGTTFTARQYADAEDIDMADASADIQAYLTAQRLPLGHAAKPLFVLYRAPGTRTRNTKWAVGERSTNARAIGRALSNDVHAKVMRAFRPDILRVAEKNPRARPLVERQIHATVDIALELIEMAAQGMTPPDEGA